MMQETENFIKIVKKYSCLWDPNVASYKCRRTRDAAWMEIIEEAGISDVETAKDKWKNLKDAFREALNKRKKENPLTKTKKLRPYKFQHVMEFLIPYLDSRCTDRTDKPQDLVYSNTANESHISSHSEQESIAYFEVDPEPNPIPVPSASQRRGYKRNHSNEILEYLVEDTQRRDSNDRHRSQVFDSLDRFFLSMAENTKKLPEHLQLMVKRKVFHAVIEAEEVNMKRMYNLSGISAEDGDIKPVISDLPDQRF